jgi:small subunit ribosomal protein S6
VKIYETLFIIHPDLEESEITRTIDVVQEIITTGGGKILKVDKWGKRQLAYMIRKKREGYYVLIYFEAPPTLIAELNRRYKLTDTIMRYLVVQLKKSQIEGVLEESAAKVKPARESSVAEFEDESEEDIYLEADEELIASTEG